MKTKNLFLSAGIFLAALSTSLAQPTITKQPSNQTASLFADATFVLLVSGDPPLSYQWRFKNAELVGMTNKTLIVTNVQRLNAGSYSVVVTNLSGSVTSQVATLTITPFNSIYAFGFSWTDTRGTGCNWDPQRYYMHRACNGPMWPEFLSTNLGLAYVEANNYAHCGALSSDVLNQVAGFPVPPKPQLSLYFLWAGDAEFFRAFPPDGGGRGYVTVTNEVAWNKIIQAAILNNSNAVVRLYAKGARAIVVAAGEGDSRNSPGAIGAFGTKSSELAKENEYEVRFHAGFFDAMNTLTQTRPDLRIFSVDTSARIDDVQAKPAEYGFTKTTIDALDDTTLTDLSFNGPGADYVFWDSGHVTSKLQKLIAEWNLEVLANSILEKLDAMIASGSPSIQMSRLRIGRDYTLQRSSDLRNWSDAQTFTASAGTNQWPGAVGDSGASYFRLKWEQ